MYTAENWARINSNNNNKSLSLGAAIHESCKNELIILYWVCDPSFVQ